MISQEEMIRDIVPVQYHIRRREIEDLFQIVEAYYEGVKVELHINKEWRFSSYLLLSSR